MIRERPLDSDGGAGGRGNLAVRVAQKKLREIGTRVMAYRAFEIDCPRRGSGAHGLMLDDERRVPQIEFQIENVVAAGRYRKGRNQADAERDRRAGRCTLRSHDLNLAARHGRSRGERKARGRIARNHQ